MKFIHVSMTILFILGACLPASAGSGKTLQKNTTIKSNEGKSMVTEEVLRRRFGQFSTAGAFVLVKIQGRETGERAVIVCENTDWYLTAREYISPCARESDYTGYMIRSHDTFLPVPGNIYRDLVKNFSAERRDVHAEDAARGMGFIAGKYLEKFEWSPGGSHAYRVKDMKLAHDRSFLRFLLELGLVVRRDCESGEIYVEAREIDGKQGRTSRFTLRAHHHL